MLGWLVGLTVVGVLGVTLAPDDRGRVREVTCEVGVSLPSWGSNELLANTALFVPVTLFAVVLFRRPVLVGVAGVLLSAAIEGTQALAVVLGRSCTTSDWVMNTAGTVLGVGVGTAVVFLAAPTRVVQEPHPLPDRLPTRPPVANPAPHPGELVGSPERG